MILYIENPKDSMKKLLKLINEFSKVADTKLISKNQLHIYMPIMNYNKEKLRKQCHVLLQEQQQKVVHRNKFNQGGKRPVFRKLHNIEERN